MYALRVLTAHGLRGQSLNDETIATTVSRMLYAPWRGRALLEERDALVFMQLYDDWSGLDIYRNPTKLSSNFAKKQTLNLL